MDSLALLIPLADHPGSALEALPFFGPVLLIGGGLVALMLRERLRSRERSEADGADS